MDRLRKAALVCRRARGVNGTTTTVLEHARRLALEGCEVHVLGRNLDEDRIRAAGAVPRRLWAWPWGSWLRRRHFAARVADLAAREGFDLVHGHGDDWSSDVLSLHNCVHAVHEAVRGAPLPAGDAVGRLHERILRGNGFKILIANSGLMAEDVRRRFGVPAEKVRVIHPGHDPSRFNPEGREALRPVLRRELGLEDRDLLVGLITSGDFEKRGVRSFQEALGRLPPALKERVYVLVAGKDARGADHAAGLRAAGLGGRFQIRPTEAKVERLYHALDLYVHPAPFEEFGQSVQEALACGVAVLTTPGVGAAELLPPDVRRASLSAADAASLSAAMARLLEDLPLREVLRRAGPPAVRANTWDRNWAETRRAYDAALRKG